MPRSPISKAYLDWMTKLVKLEEQDAENAELSDGLAPAVIADKAKDWTGQTYILVAVGVGWLVVWWW